MASSQRSDILRAAASLIERVIPGQSRFFVVEQIAPQDGLDVFEVESRGDWIVLRGSGGVAIASALTWYLEHGAGAHTPHYANSHRVNSRGNR